MTIKRLGKPVKFNMAIEFDGLELFLARDALGVTQTDFAKACGWTQPWQCILERPGAHIVDIESMNKIYHAVQHFITP